MNNKDYSISCPDLKEVKISETNCKMASYEKKEINHLFYNQEHNLFTCSMDSGVKVYNVDPLAIKTSLDSAFCGSVAHCQVLHRTNLIALVGGGSKPKFADNAGKISAKIDRILFKLNLFLL